MVREKVYSIYKKCYRTLPRQQRSHAAEQMLFVGANRNNFDIPGQSLADQHLLGQSVSQLRTMAGRTRPVSRILQMAAASAVRDHLIGRRIQQQGFYSSFL